MFSRWFQTFLCSCLFGEDSHLDYSDGLKPTSVFFPNLVSHSEFQKLNTWARCHSNVSMFLTPSTVQKKNGLFLAIHISIQYSGGLLYMIWYNNTYMYTYIYIYTLPLVVSQSNYWNLSEPTSIIKWDRGFVLCVNCLGQHQLEGRENCTWTCFVKVTCVVGIQVFSSLLWLFATQIFFGKPYGCFQIIHFNWVFHYKPSILGYPYFWKHPYRSMKIGDTCMLRLSKGNLRRRILRSMFYREHRVGYLKGKQGGI